METKLNQFEKDEIRNGVSSQYLLKSGSSYNTIQIEVIWVDDEGKVTVDGALFKGMYGASSDRICTFTNSVIGENWLTIGDYR